MTNYFCPQQKLISKSAHGAKVTKKYDRAQTPYQRVIASPHVTKKIKTTLTRQYRSLNPAQMRRDIPKLARILALYDQAPRDGRVICIDEFGPLNLMPRPGKGWYPIGKPKRLRATFHRTAGVRHMFAALDLACGSDVLPRPRPQTLERVSRLPATGPPPISRPAGSMSCSTTTARTTRSESAVWCVGQRRRAGLHPDERIVERTGSSASSPPCATSPSTAATTPTTTPRTEAIANYVRWRNKHAKPKVTFAIGSKIREPDYLPKGPDAALVSRV